MLDPITLKNTITLASNGSTTAALALHRHYSIGEQDSAEGKRWLGLAIENGSQEAMILAAGELIYGERSGSWDRDARGLLNRVRDLAQSRGDAQFIHESEKWLKELEEAIREEKSR